MLNRTNTKINNISKISFQRAIWSFAGELGATSSAGEGGDTVREGDACNTHVAWVIR